MLVKPPLRLLIWSSIPTHHQSAFFAALRERNIDLIVNYLQQVDAGRLRLGWSAPPALPAGEHYVPQPMRALDRGGDWRERIHIVPGYNRVFLLRLALLLSRERIPWLHWSEHSQPRPRADLTMGLKRAYGLLVSRHSLGALAIGELARQEFIRWGIPAGKIRFLPYAVAGFGAIGAASDAPTSPGGAVRFLFLGSLYPIKGIDLLLAAFRDVLGRSPGARLELAGHDRSNGRYARDAAHLGIGHAVRFTGAVEATRVGVVLQRCDVLILPSRHDGWGVVLNEAASMGKAIIASDACGAAYHLLAPQVNGWRFPSGDAASLARAMAAYCDEPQLAARHGAESLRIFADFTPERNAQRLEEALDSLQAAACSPLRVSAA
jgi:glycosyltransferase involved in cell wall biosynthesis